MVEMKRTDRKPNPRPGTMDKNRTTTFLHFTSRSDIHMEGEEPGIDDVPMRPTDKINTVYFSELCEQLEKVVVQSNAEKKLHYLGPTGKKTWPQKMAGQSVHPLFRLLMPQLDRARMAYGLKNATIAKMYVENLGLVDSNSDAQKLKNWKDPDKASGGRYGARKVAGGGGQATGDFAAVLEEVLKVRCPAERRVKRTIGDVNELLDKLQRGTSAAEKKAVLMTILQDYTAVEQKWLVRMILKDMKMGLGHERLLKHYHPDAVDLYNKSSDLRYVCDALHNPSVRHVAQIAPMRPFKPMLAKPPMGGLHKCDDAMKNNPLLLEPKLDGERLLLHKRGQEVRLFTRKPVDCTSIYGDLLAPLARSQIDVEECVLDGEVLAWDDEAQFFVEFGKNKTVALMQVQAQQQGGVAAAGTQTEGVQNEKVGGRRWICFVVFDILYLRGAGVGEAVAAAVAETAGAGGFSQAQLQAHINASPAPAPAGGTGAEGIVGGGSLTGLSLLARRKLLPRFVRPVPHRLDIIWSTVVADTARGPRMKHILESLDRMLTSRYEGLMVKDLLSPYDVGMQRNGRWAKLKPDYNDQTEHYDLVILGGYYGDGKGYRAGEISKFLLGVAAPTTGAGGGGVGGQLPTRFLAFAKVGSGYNREELMELRNHLQPHWRPWGEEGRAPPHIVRGWRPRKADTPDVWIPPEHSRIMEAYGFEITPSENFNSGYTLRFPRVHKIRYDKEWFECMTMDELRQQVMVPAEMRHKRAVDVGGFTPEKKRAKRSAAKRTTRPYVSALDMAPDKASVAVLGQLFRGLEVLVLPGNFVVKKPHGQGTSQIPVGRSMSKRDVESVVLGQGGTLTQNLLASTRYILAPDERGVKVKNLMSVGTHDILRVDWVLGCIDEGRLVPPCVGDLVYMCDATRERLAQTCDVFGDSYEEDTDVDQLKLVFEEVARAKASERRVGVGVEGESGGSNSSKRRRGRRGLLLNVNAGVGRLAEGGGKGEGRLQDWRERVVGLLQAKSDTGEKEGTPKLQLTMEEGDAMCCRAGTFLWRVVAFVDGMGGGAECEGEGGGEEEDDLMMRCKSRHSPMDLVAMRLRLGGARVVSRLSSDVTHVVVEPPSSAGPPRLGLGVEKIRQRMAELRGVRGLSGRTVEKRVVAPSWVDACMAEREQVGVELGGAHDVRLG